MCGLGTLDSAVIKALKFEFWICLTCPEGSVHLNHLPSDEDLPVRLKFDEELAPLPIWHPWIWNVADNLLFTIWQPEICYFWSDSLKASGNFDPGRTIAPHWSQLSNKQLDHSSWPALALPKMFLNLWNKTKYEASVKTRYKSFLPVSLPVQSPPKPTSKKSTAHWKAWTKYG